MAEDARELLAAASPRPWHVVYGSIIRGVELVVDCLDGANPQDDAALIVRAANEYEALLYLEETLRASHGDPIAGRRMGCQTCDALERLDEVRRG